jgi:hypothetical protein
MCCPDIIAVVDLGHGAHKGHGRNPGHGAHKRHAVLVRPRCELLDRQRPARSPATCSIVGDLLDRERPA